MRKNTAPPVPGSAASGGGGCAVSAVGSGIAE
jgi:hypothetical protein